VFTFENLTVYQDSLDLADEIYKITESWPKSELFGLTGQIRRAAVSVSLNIAEGSGRTKKDFRHFLDMARTSCQECVPLLELARRRNFISEEISVTLYESFSKLARQISSLKRSILL